METIGSRGLEPRRPRNGNIDSLPHGEITDVILSGMFTVHRTFGAGFLESVYANALAVELRKRGLRVDRNVAFEVYYRDTLVGRCIADFVVESKVIVEIKAARTIHASYRDQVLNYLQASKLQVGLVLNFGPSPQFKRVVRSRTR